jgi:hypothetical protein
MSLGKRSLSCPREDLTFFSLRNNHVPKEEEFKLPWGTPCARGEQGLKLFGGLAMFHKEQMCSKFCLTINFAYEL